MSRIPFSQVLKNAKIDIRREYDRLYELFFRSIVDCDTANITTLYYLCDKNFTAYPFRGTCISLNDFNVFYGYRFKEHPSNFDLDYLISFCEYSYNLAKNIPPGSLCSEWNEAIHFYLQQINLVVEKIGYMANPQGAVIDFVPKDQVAISVAEIVDPNLSYRVIEYNHHSMWGDLERKKETLRALGDKLEPLRPKLKQINASLASDIFFLLNTLNIRHNNTDSGKKQIPFVSDMDKAAIEQWYDDTYQLCLLAFLELDNLVRKDRVKLLRENLKKK